MDAVPESQIEIHEQAVPLYGYQGDVRPQKAHIVIRRQRIGSGAARVIESIAEMDRVEPGDVLVTDMTDPDWEPIMKRASAIVTNRGGRTCHAAIIARELGVPAVVGTARSINDTIATDLASRFYSSLGQGNAIERAWEEAEDWREPTSDIIYLLDTIVGHITAPEFEEGTTQMQISSISYSCYIRRIAVGRL